MITIWFEPHATSLDNEAHLASGWNDVDLSETGIRQTFELRDYSLARGIDTIFTSDAQRAYKTAVPLASALNVPIHIDARLRECNYGDLTQHPKKVVDQEKLLRISNPFPNGESYADTAERMHEFLIYLRDNFDAKTVLIVGHRATQYGIENFILKKPLEKCVSEPWAWQPGWKYTL